MNDEDHALLTAWQRGNTDAGHQLVARHTPTLHRFFASKAPEALEDLVQQTFLAAVESRGRFRSDSKFRTFLLGIARNILLKYFRKHMREDRAMGIHEVSAASISPSPSQSAALRQEVRLLLHGLRSLPIDQQIAVELFYWEDLGIDDVADVLGVAPGTVKSRLGRARDKLRTAMARTTNPEPFARPTAEELQQWADAVRAEK